MPLSRSSACGSEKTRLPQLLPVQFRPPEYLAKGVPDAAAQGLVLPQGLMIHGVAVQYRAAQRLQRLQGAGLSGPGAAGDADDHWGHLRQ